jgi:hypothetical protein
MGFLVLECLRFCAMPMDFYPYRCRQLGCCRRFFDVYFLLKNFNLAWDIAQPSAVITAMDLYLGGVQLGWVLSGQPLVRLEPIKNNTE